MRRASIVLIVGALVAAFATVRDGTGQPEGPEQPDAQRGEDDRALPEWIRVSQQPPPPDYSAAFHPLTQGLVFTELNASRSAAWTTQLGTHLGFKPRNRVGVEPRTKADVDEFMRLLRDGRLGVVAELTIGGDEEQSFETLAALKQDMLPPGCAVSVRARSARVVAGALALSRNVVLDWLTGKKDWFAASAFEDPAMAAGIRRTRSLTCYNGRAAFITALASIGDQSSLVSLSASFHEIDYEAFAAQLRGFASIPSLRDLSIETGVRPPEGRNIDLRATLAKLRSLSWRVWQRTMARRRTFA